MPIVINKKTDRFFISIHKSKLHSFVLLGTYDQFEVKHLLSRVGKLTLREKDCWSQIWCVPTLRFYYRALFTHVPAQLMDESDLPKAVLRESSYQAYDMTYAHYLEFIEILKSLQTPQNKFMCYLPIHEEGDNVTMERYQLINASSALESCKLKDHAAGLNVGNTCRHIAIELVEAVQHTPISPLISSSFLNDLPYTTVLESGQPSKAIPYYVLPLSPATYSDLEESKKIIIEKLYERMENMPLIAPHSQQTQDKFIRLKELYLNIVGPQKERSLSDLLMSIRKWKEDNKDKLTPLREKFPWDFFMHRKSATMAMFDSIEDNLSKQINLNSSKI